MKQFLIVTAILECAVGVALLAVPARLASILVGGSLDTPAALVVARLAGVALLSLGGACWAGSRDSEGRVAIGIVAAMLLYNIAAATVLVSARFCQGMTGIGLLPAAVLHVGLAVWCAACLNGMRAARASTNVR
jgi:hypothetical protein